MVNQPDQNTQGGHTPARKLVLPEPPDAGQQRQPYSSPRSGWSINLPTSAAAHGLFTHIKQRVYTEPAFALLALAVALVVISSFVFVALGLSAMNSNSSGPTWNSAMTQHPAVPTPTGTVDIKPTFPTPVSGKGSSSTSQPNPNGSTNPQPTATDNGDQGTLSVNIANIPNVVTNDSRVQVDVQTSEPNVDVHLEVTYDASPFNYTNGGDTTDDNGNATLNWNVRVRSSNNGNNVQAIVIVVATDNNGQQATSQPTTVEVTP